jgi:hypothetical protein
VEWGLRGGREMERRGAEPDEETAEIIKRSAASAEWNSLRHIQQDKDNNGF